VQVNTKQSTDVEYATHACTIWKDGTSDHSRKDYIQLSYVLTLLLLSSESYQLTAFGWFAAKLASYSAALHILVVYMLLLGSRPTLALALR
jgi:hypothetical protein